MSIYDNDEVMAALGRTVMDIVLNQTDRVQHDQQIAFALLHTVEQYIEEDEGDDQGN